MTTVRASVHRLWGRFIGWLFATWEKTPPARRAAFRRAYAICEKSGHFFGISGREPNCRRCNKRRYDVICARYGHARLQGRGRICARCGRPVLNDRHQ